VIADVQMPSGNGLQLQQRLRENGLSMPLILLAAQDTDEMRAEAKCGGFAGFFRKPVDDQALIDAIEWALNKAAWPF
jgi:FixJ family two-component response regulator